MTEFSLLQSFNIHYYYYCYYYYYYVLFGDKCLDYFVFNYLLINS